MVRLKRLWSAALGLSCAALLNVAVAADPPAVDATAADAPIEAQPSPTQATLS